MCSLNLNSRIKELRRINERGKWLEWYKEMKSLSPIVKCYIKKKNQQKNLNLMVPNDYKSRSSSIRLILRIWREIRKIDKWKVNSFLYKELQLRQLPNKVLSIKSSVCRDFPFLFFIKQINKQFIHHYGKSSIEDHLRISIFRSCSVYEIEPL